jgi:hypothetical protein
VKREDWRHLTQRYAKMEEEVKKGGSIGLFVPFLTAFLGVILFYLYSWKNHSDFVKKEAADKLLAKEKAPVPAQPVQGSKKNVASAKQKAIAAEKVCFSPSLS